MAKDLVQEAYAQIDAMRDAATETAKNILIEAMSTDLKAAVAQAMSETLVEDEDQVEEIEEASVEEVSEGEDSTDEESIEEGSIEEGSYSEEDMMDDEDEDEEEEDDDEEELDEMDDMEEPVDEEVIEVVEAEEMSEEAEVSDVDALRQENIALRQENKKYEKALISVKKQMDEINLFNARLAAATDLMRTVPLTKGQKEKVVENFDAAKTIGEVKRMHKIISEAYKGNEKTTTKPRVSRPNVQSVVTEGVETQDNTVYDRLAKLAGTL